MPVIDKAAGRVVALIVALLLAGASLRGRIPGAEPTARSTPTPSTAAQAVLIALCGGSTAIIAVAIVTRLRNRRATPAGIGALPAAMDGRTGRPNWRVLLIVLAVGTAWASAFWLLTMFVGRRGSDAPVPGPGTHIGVPVPGTAPAPPRTAPPAPGAPLGPESFGYLAGAAAIMLVLVIVAIAVTARNRRAGALPQHRVGNPPSPASSTYAALARAAELGLAAIGDPGGDPREAIIRCYATMEAELARLPDVAPRDCDTATDVLARAVAHRAVPAANATRLVSLFAEARFSPHPMTERHRDAAVRMLRLVLAELRGPA